MLHANQPQAAALHLYQMMRAHPARWLAPTVLIAAAALIFAWFVHEPMWEASQALTVRDETSLLGESSARGGENENLKHTQETILELATSPAVVAATLRQIGPPANRSASDAYPNPLEIDDARKRIKVAPPHGAEFGTTRVFYLRVQDPDPHRAIRLTEAVRDHAERQFQELRGRKARDVIEELSNAVSLARCDLEQSTAALADIESSVGPDLGALRTLNESLSGDNSLQATLVELRQELRQAENQRQGNQQLLHLLIAATQNPAHLVATPHRLLESQPALRQLKEGLIAAQLQSSNLMGTMSNEHPQVAAAQVAETEIRGHLHRELELAIRGLQTEQAVIDSQIATLTQRLTELNQRMQRLAAIRADYGRRVAEVRQQTENLTRAQQELAQARAGLAAGESNSLITRIDTPQTGPTPQGPGRTMLAAAGLVGGLLTGLGLLVLTTPPPTQATCANPSTAEQVQTARVAQPFSPQASPPQAALTSATTLPADAPAKSPPWPAAAIRRTTGNMTLKEALMRCAEANSETRTPTCEPNHVGTSD